MVPERPGKRYRSHGPGRCARRSRFGSVAGALLVAVSAGPLLASCSGDGQQSGAAPTGPDVQEFPVPRRIVVSVAPYASVDEALQAATSNDWAGDAQRSRAITLAYAARELRDHLAMAGVDAQISIAAASPGEPAILLWSRDAAAPDPAAPPPDLPVTHEALGEQGYAVTPWNGRLYVTANSRHGVLYGVYGLLGQLGYEWYDPYETVAPTAPSLTRPIAWRQIQARPRVDLRGFWIYGNEPIPDEFAVWMARNRLNIGGRARSSLQQMLGLKGWAGGHELLQEEFSRPGLFEQHPDWFALVDGSRQPVIASGNYFNPSFASADAAEYFAERMIQRLESGDLRGVDVLNIWPTDDRFNRFDQSEAARAIGNETDNLLYFYANLTRHLRAAQAAGRLSRAVRVSGISYFLTMNAPTNRQVVRELEGTDYLHLFYPIERDWSGRVDVNLEGRDANRKLVADLAAWQAIGSLGYGVVEYHNLSAFAAVGVSDFPHFAANFGTLTEGRDRLYAYMHPLLRNPGPRRLTNNLLARLAWQELGLQGESTVEQGDRLVALYFQRRYGALAEEWRAIHELMSRSVENAKELFGTNSLSWMLLQEQIWASPFYSRSQVAAFLPRFRAGGVQDLPAAFSGVTVVRATFRGLDESLGLQAEASARWRTLLERQVAPEVRRRMDSDVEWFEATASRYRLMAASCDYVTARERGEDLAGPRSRAMQEIEFLRGSSVTADTVSPVDQRGFLDLHESLVAAP